MEKTSKLTIERCYSPKAYNTIRLGMEVDITPTAVTDAEAIREAFLKANAQLNATYAIILNNEFNQ